METEKKTLIKVNNLVMHFPIYRGVISRQVGAVHAVDGISFDIVEGETLGLVGESVVENQRLAEPYYNSISQLQVKYITKKKIL